MCRLGGWSLSPDDGVTSYKNDDYTDIVRTSTFVSMMYAVLTTETAIDGNNSKHPVIISLLSRRGVQ